MLFIGDIHIISKHASNIIATIDQIVQSLPNENNIIVAGDIVYHFTYDRKAILELFSYFVNLTHHGKSIYIVAGNHDRVGGSFVFEEAKKTLELIENPPIYCITEPRETTIQGVCCYFFPYHKPSITEFDHDWYPTLRGSGNPSIEMSWQANNILRAYIEKNKEKEILIIHHRYIANTQFPGQKALFDYKNTALDPRFIDQPNIRMISGHLHACFGYKQYLCIGSVWHTTPLEVNQQKFLFQFDPVSNSVQAFPIHYNPYLQIPSPEKPLSGVDITTMLKTIFEQTVSNLNQGNRTVQPHWCDNNTLQYTTLIITRNDSSGADVHTLLDTELHHQIGAIKQKLIVTSPDTLFMQTTDASVDLKNRFSDWKVLLTQFIEQKYKNHASIYLNFLKEEKIM